jgi:WD40 repeat protein
VCECVCVCVDVCVNVCVCVCVNVCVCECACVTVTLHFPISTTPPPHHHLVGNSASCLRWNSSPTDAPTMVVGSNKTAEIWEFNAQNRRWQQLLSLKEEGKSDPHDATVQDVAWAPQLGRSYHLVATACRDTFVRIFKVYLHTVPKGQQQVALVAEIGAHQTEVWRVSWNVTGTMLASTGDDGMTRLWKSDFQLNFHPVLMASGSEDSPVKATGQPASTQQPFGFQQTERKESAWGR